MTANAAFRREEGGFHFTPNADAAPGDVIVQNDLIGITKEAVPANMLGYAHSEGHFILPKASGASTGQALGLTCFWDATNLVVSLNAADGRRLGVIAEASADADTTVVVDVNADGPGKQAAAQPALVDDSGGATATGTIAAITNPDLSAWDGAHDPTAAQATAINAAITAMKNAIKELSTKQNAVIAAAKAAGQMAQP